MEWILRGLVTEFAGAFELRFNGIPTMLAKVQAIRLIRHRFALSL